MFCKFVSAAVLACAIPFAAGAASADPLSFSVRQAPSIKVSYGDLNLSRPADLRLLADRIKSAAESVCQTVAGEGNRGLTESQVQQDVQACTRRAVEMSTARLERQIGDGLRQGIAEGPADVAVRDDR